MSIQQEHLLGLALRFDMTCFDMTSLDLGVLLCHGLRSHVLGQDVAAVTSAGAHGGHGRGRTGRRRALALREGGAEARRIHVVGDMGEESADNGRHQLELLLGGLVVRAGAFDVAGHARLVREGALAARAIGQSYTLFSVLA